MVVPIQQVLRPLLITCFIMGLGVYPMKQPNPRIRWIAYLSILYCLIIWVSYAYLFYYVVISFTWEVLYADTTNSVIIIIHIITTAISVIMSFYHQKRFEINLKKLSAVDNSLEELGVSIMNQNIHMYSKIAIIGWIVYSLAVNFLDSIWWTSYVKLTSWGLFLAYILNHCLHVNAFTDLLFTFLLWYICIKFDTVNEYIRCLLIREDRGLRCTEQKSTVVLHRYTLGINYKQTLWTSMHLHLELCRITREFNFLFGIQITFGMTTYLMYLTSTCYGLCLYSMQQFSKEILQTLFIWINVGSWAILLLIRMYFINYICESVMTKANEINKTIHQLTNILRYADVCEEIYQFTLQIMHHPLKLTGMNLFYLGNKCFRKVCITIVTFVIIMVQMNVNINLEGNLL
ncbi:PREDICTED: uncharacterized protein LOC105560874 [Vollenhovia emeryi]|uniref:uncharacterized protein LOC105560874 n=1 Tax=Vollenhovia emeryi TaxID=411798 RepID=UPI0005F49ABC|nr:PREDICTED: uncharacterized protein LOC105560874 [Vollenhovia emeryi]